MTAPPPPTPHRQRPLRGRRTRVAVAVSVVAHALLGGLLLRAPRTRSPAPAPASLELEIITSEEAPIDEAPGATGEAPALAPAPGTPARPRSRPRRTTAGPLAEAPPPTPAQPTPEANPVPTDVPLPRDEGTATLSMRFPPRRSAGTLLTPSFDTIDRLTREGVIAAPDPEAVARPARPRGPTFSERLAARVREDGARANVAEGKVHPAVYDLLRDSRRDFRPTPEILADDPRTPNTVARTLRQWGRWLGETGHRQLGEQSRRLREHHAARRGQAARELDRSDEDVLPAAAPISCLVCLVLRPPAAPEVVLGSSSGNAALDREAMIAVRRAVDNRPLEADVRTQRSCYRFQATVFRVPPLPVLGCGPDGTGGLQCTYPLKKLLKTTVTLESVEYGG